MAAPTKNKSVTACETGAWHLALWPKNDPSHVRRVCFRCRSWRHPGECREWRGKVDFARICEGIKTRHDWVYIVLTFDQRHHKFSAPLYRKGVVMWSALRKRFTRAWGPIAYIQTWEQHKSGFPHVNVLIGNPGFHEAATCNWRHVRKTWLKPNATACGFGFTLWVKPVYDAQGMAGYLCKLANELTGADKKDQTPICAPSHFRRIRASQGLLPPPHKDPELTGKLWQAPIESFIRGVTDA